jgi:AraC-like DNA-binding protein
VEDNDGGFAIATAQVQFMLTNATPAQATDRMAFAGVAPGSKQRGNSAAPNGGARFFAQLASDVPDAAGDNSIESAVAISPPEAAKRRTARWRGMAAEIVQMTGHDRVEFSFHASTHLLVAYEEASRDAGESVVEGAQRSTLHNMSRRLTLVPAGHDYSEWHRPRSPMRLIYFYLHPNRLAAAVSFTPRLFFDNHAIWDTAIKLKQSIEHANPDGTLYSEAVGLVLMHELINLERGGADGSVYVRGGLAAHARRIIADYIEAHLSEQVSIATLAEIAHLSPFHFSRAFKTSFGVPPHRYHTARRIERAKVLLAEGALSVTEIGLKTGFADTSSFSAAFRKTTGITPRDYQRSFA